MEAIIKMIKVSDKGQIALPKDIRESADIKTGDSLVLVQKGKRIMLEKSSVIKDKVEDDFKDILKLSEITTKKLWNNKYDEVWDKI